MTDERYAVIYLSSIDWDFRRQDHQFICLDLASRGRRVLFVENTGVRFPAPRDADRVISRLKHWASATARPQEPLPGLVEVASPLVLPGASLGPERAVNAALFRLQLAGAVRRLGPRPHVLWVGLPTWAAIDLAAWLRPDLLVYYCGDAFAEIPGVRAGVRGAEREIVRRSDVVFANSRALVEHCAAMGGPTPVLVPIGIDLAASEDARAGRTPVPPELRGLRGRLIGYMGGLNHKVDVGLLDAVSRAFPGDTLVVLGSLEDPRYRPEARGNVVVLGERPYERVGEYLVRFAVCLIPYVLNEFTAGVYPGKLVEYLAAGRPVVSTPLPEVLPYSAVVRIAETPDGFVGAVAEALAEPETVAARAERVRWASRNAYERITAEMVGVAEERLGRRGEPRLSRPARGAGA